MKMERGKAFVKWAANRTLEFKSANRGELSKAGLSSWNKCSSMISPHKCRVYRLPRPAEMALAAVCSTCQIRYQGFPKKLPPRPRPARRTDEKLRMAGGRVPEKGLVLDYTLENGSITNITFQGDTTYYLSGTVNIYTRQTRLKAGPC